MKTKMIEYFEAELVRTKFQLEKMVEGDKYTTPYSIVSNAIAHCFGVAEFCLSFMGYDEVQYLYNQQKKELEGLLK